MELRDYLNVIRARKWIIIQAVVIVTLTAVVVSLVQPPVYEGTAKVLIAEKDTGAALLGTVFSEFSQPERGLQTQVQLMQMRPIYEDTIRTLGLGITPDALAGKVEVAAVGQTNVVEITARDTDPALAAQIANTVAGEFVQWSRDYKRESIQAAITEVESRLSEAESDILELADRIDASGRTDQLDAELAIATGSYTELAAQLEQLKINEQLERGTGAVVSPAVQAEDPVEPSPARNGALGLAVGLVFGLGMAFLYEYLDNTIKSSDEAEKLLDAPVLGLIPAEKFEKGEKRRVTLLTHPTSAAAEAYRVLRNNLDFVNFQHDITTLLVTSAAPAEGKSTVAANLAAGLAQAGKKVVLVNCDFRKPVTSQFFPVSNMIGLSDVLLGKNSLKAALQKPNENLELLVLTAGKLPPNPSELLGSEKMDELIANLEEWADWVILDTPPLLAVADGASVARWADGVLLVTKGGESTREAVKRAHDMLGQVGARVVGSVVWGLEPGPGGGGYGYYYGRGKYGGYYYYADYYNATQDDGRRRTGGGPPRGGVASAESTTREVYLPPTSPGRKLAESVGKVLTGGLAAAAILAILALVVYFLDQALGWGIVVGLVGAS
ncbi:MAG: polysaccharide biosynthesis tyrosine autokinase [Anaerosomatales bacterium]|nr:polysaccharide biosynthesis tyrosine autokinase [Anaerosomatales bacterium]